LHLANQEWDKPGIRWRRLEMELTKVGLRKQCKIPSKLSDSSTMDYRMASVDF